MRRAAPGLSGEGAASTTGRGKGKMPLLRSCATRPDIVRCGMSISIVPASSSRFLGIQTGATHTTVLLADEKGTKLLQFDLGPANLRLISDYDLTRMFREIQKQTGEVSAIGAGMAGLRNERDRSRVLRLAKKVWPRTPFHAAHDLESSLRATGDFPKETEARVLLLSGTGSCAYGNSRDGRTMKFGGRGHILGDQGSACDIALTALRRIVYHHDLNEKFPKLGEAVLRATQLNEPDDLIPWTMEADKDELARLAVTIFEQAQRGDKIAKAVVSEAADKLADMAVHCAEHLLPHHRRVQFILAGGVFLHQAAFVAAVSRRIHARWKDCDVRSLKKESVWGALALTRENIEHRTLKNEHRSKKHRSSMLDVQCSMFSVHGSPVPMDSLSLSPTEQRNPKSMRLDKMPLGEAVELMLREDAKVPGAILREKRALLWLLRKVIHVFNHGGRLFYAGAGTSGRLGILDASECPPTFRAPAEQVQGIIAGGRRAIWSAVEGAEDDYAGGAMAVRYRGVGKGDVLLGIAASGRTPFVWGALREAKQAGAITALLCFNPKLKVRRGHQPDRMILINTGPEVLTGSTRLKAGTATKLVLNILTTLAMVHGGKVISNLMVEMHPTNAKLRDRAVRLLVELTGCDRDEARQTLEDTDWMVQKACTRLLKKRKQRRNHLPKR